MIGRRPLLFSVFSVPLIGAVCAASPAHGMDSPLRIGVLGDLTGPLAQHGKRQLLGAQHRAGGGTHGSGIELMPRDTATAPEDAVFGLLEEGVHALIALSTAPSLVDAANASCTPLVTTMGTAEGPYVFQAGPSSAQVAQATMRTLSQGKVPSVALLSLGEPNPAFPEVAAGRGITMTGSQSFDTSATDLTSVAKALMDTSPGALVVDALPPFNGYAARDARAAGWTGPMFFGPSAADVSFHAVAGPGADGAKAVTPWVVAADPPADLPNATVIRRFKDGFTPANGAPGAFESAAADAVTLLHLAFLGHRDRKQAKAQLDQMCCVGVCGQYNPKLADDALTVLTSKDGAWG